MDGYTYGYPVGGEHVCEVCGQPARKTETHTAWHEGLTVALSSAGVDWRLLNFNCWPVGGDE